MAALAKQLERGLFITDLCMKEIGEKKGRTVYELLQPLIFITRDGRRIVVPTGFQTDLASVPRLPFVYLLWGDRAHREAVLHDYLFRKDSVPVATFMEANGLFLEAMTSRGVRWAIRWPMYAAVCAGGRGSYHKLLVDHQYFPAGPDIF